MIKGFSPVIEIVSVVKDDLQGLSNTYQSLLMQTVQDFKWLVIDGSSDPIDFSELFLEAKFSIRVVQQSPKGIYHAMNYAISITEGEMLWYLNAGDSLSNPKAVEDVTKIIAENPQHQVFGFSVRHLDKFGQVWHTSNPKLRYSVTTGYIVADINHQGFIASIEALESTGGFDVSLKFAADGKLQDSIACKYNILLNNTVVVNFVLGGASGQNISKTLEEIDSYRPFQGSALMHKWSNKINVLKTRTRFAGIEQEGVLLKLILAVRKIRI